jgi:hypothetical protein
MFVRHVITRFTCSYEAERYNFAWNGQICFLGLDMLNIWGGFIVHANDMSVALDHEVMFLLNLVAWSLTLI